MYTCFSLPGLGRVQISRPFLTKSFEMLGFPDSSGRNAPKLFVPGGFGEVGSSRRLATKQPTNINNNQQPTTNNQPRTNQATNNHCSYITLFFITWDMQHAHETCGLEPWYKSLVGFAPSRNVSISNSGTSPLNPHWSCWLNLFSIKLVGGFKHFLFLPLPGEMIQFD